MFEWNLKGKWKNAFFSIICEEKKFLNEVSW